MGTGYMFRTKQRPTEQTELYLDANFQRTLAYMSLLYKALRILCARRLKLTGNTTRKVANFRKSCMRVTQRLRKPEQNSGGRTVASLFFVKRTPNRNDWSTVMWRPSIKSA